MFGIVIDRNISCSLMCQITGQIREKITEGEMPSGLKMPSTRALADAFGVSRNVVIEVYEQLIAEGYLESGSTSGTFVARGILPQKMKPAPFQNKTANILPKMNRIDFDAAAGIPDLKAFPARLWRECADMALTVPESGVFSQEDVFGDTGLRELYCGYLYRSKGIQVSPEQLVITAGTAEASLLLSRVFQPDFRSIAVEDPTLETFRDIFESGGYSILPVPVTSSGIDTAGLPASGKNLLLVTPSHQFPTGSILSIKKRQDILAWADQHRNYVIEDDYDGEFRLKGLPVPPLYTLNPDRVIYLFSFSKCLFPGIRAGAMIVPETLVPVVRHWKERLAMRTASITQKTLFHFIREGHFERHIHRMRKLYGQKRAVLIREIEKQFGDGAEVFGSEAGMHMQLDLKRKKSRNIVWKEAEEQGIVVASLADYSVRKDIPVNRIFLGYGNLTEDGIVEGIRRLKQFLDRIN